VGAGSIGPAGSERPVVPIDDTHYVDVADVVDDFDEAFFGSGGLSRLGEVVQERSAARQLREFAGERIGAPIARPHQILCIGLNYSDPRGRDRCACTRRANTFPEVAQHTCRHIRRCPHPAGLDQAGLGSRTGCRDR
jgi:hypothetical protein